MGIIQQEEQFTAEYGPVSHRDVRRTTIRNQLQNKSGPDSEADSTPLFKARWVTSL